MKHLLLALLLSTTSTLALALDPGMTLGLGVGIDYTDSDSTYPGAGRADGYVVTAKYFNAISKGQIAIGATVGKYEHTGAPDLTYQTFDLLYLAKITYSVDYFILSYGSATDDPEDPATQAFESDVFGIGYGGTSNQFFLDIRYLKFLDDGPIDSTLQFNIGLMF